MADHLDGLALRVPIPDGSITDLVAVVRDTPSVGETNAALRSAAEVGRLARYLEFSEDPLVSSDIANSPAFCVFDCGLTMAKGHLVKVLGWYDNETGYSSRLAGLAELLGTAGG